MQINAPYTGAGLITIERDKVYAWKWFRAESTASLQEIPLPEGLEGGGYVSVSFVRDPGSPDVHTAPLSFGVVPFSVARDARTAGMTLTAPAKARPGDLLTAHLTLAKPARVIVWAVDEGILQAARQTPPDPLGFYFQKRMLGVTTRQILDMILPEFSRLVAAGLAPGGDAGEGAGRFLNPFRRRTDPPVAFWSGVLDLPAGPRDVAYRVPDSFNGELHWMAVVVEDTATSASEARTRVAADVVLQPSLPLVVAPGDEFDLSVAVANRAEGSGPKAQVNVALTVSPQLAIVKAPRSRAGGARGPREDHRLASARQRPAGGGRGEAGRQRGRAGWACRVHAVRAAGDTPADVAPERSGRCG